MKEGLLSFPAISQGCSTLDVLSFAHLWRPVSEGLVEPALGKQALTPEWKSDVLRKAGWHFPMPAVAAGARLGYAMKQDRALSPSSQHPGSQQSL